MIAPVLSKDVLLPLFAFLATSALLWSSKTLKIRSQLRPPTFANVSASSTLSSSASLQPYQNNGQSFPKRYELPPWRRPQEPDYFDNWKVVSKQRNLVVNYIPKVMCTSIRNAMNVMECHNKTIRCAEAKTDRYIRSIDVSNMTRVIMFRDPFERARSAYLNSADSEFIYVPSCRSSWECTFAEWVDRIYRDPPAAFVNNHSRPQVQIAQFDKMHYHYYLRMSSPIDQDFFWNVLLGLPPKRDNTSTNRSSSSSSSSSSSNTITTSTMAVQEIMKDITDETMLQLAEIYHEDVVLWDKLLRFGTPRQDDEYTMYDYFQEHIQSKQRQEGGGQKLR